MTNNENKPLKPPINKDLPFFAYGIFKPGQIAYSRIKDCVKNKYKDEINYKMLMRDGVPLITSPKDGRRNKTQGYLVYFNEKDCKKAYEIISKTHYEKLYKWKEIKVGENKANVLMGVNTEMGIDSIEGNIVNYEGKQDIYFKDAIETVKKELDDETDFFKLQMRYLLLWTAIERYCSLKYNKPESKLKQLSEDDLFKKSLKKHFTSKRTVYSSENLRNCTLDPENPEDSIHYYYTIRCNVTHKGKASYDYELIEQSLKELLEIFKDILDETFDKT